MSPRLSETEKAGLVAKIENERGIYITEVEEVTLLPTAAGTCRCGNHIAAFINVMWCDECFAAFEELVAQNHPDPFEGPRERWRANGWTPGCSW